MAHLRTRYLENVVEKAMTFSPLVGILGHRQVGKTTFLHHYSKKYLTFDDEDILKSAQESPKQFIAPLHQLGCAIDESQMVPGLFPALKERVRKDKRPGQFLLSGSVRFTSRKAIEESLTGRIVNLELLPFTVSEITRNDLSDLCLRLVSARDLSGFLEQQEGTIAHSKVLEKEIDLYLDRGGLPSIVFIREARARALRISEQLTTILDRDLRMVYPTSLGFSQILDYVKELSTLEGRPVRFSELERKTGITEVTQKKLFYALESVFILRRLPIEGGRKGHTVYFEDQAEARHLADYRKNEEVALEGLVYRCVRAQWAYRMGERFRFFHYLSRGGARVPVAIETDKGTLGIILIGGTEPNRSELGTASSFLKAYGNSKILFTGRRLSPQLVDSRSVVLPLSALV